MTQADRMVSEYVADKISECLQQKGIHTYTHQELNNAMWKSLGVEFCGI